MQRNRWLLGTGSLVLLAALAGCHSEPPRTPARSASSDRGVQQADERLADRETARMEAAQERADDKAVSGGDTLRGPQARDTARADTDFPPNDSQARTDYNPISQQRARKLYLQGVRLLYDPQGVDEAIRQFQLALEADPLFYKAHFKLGLCYYHEGQYELEIAEYKKCLAINPMYAPAQLDLGHAYLAQDNLEQARDAYKKVLDIQPNNAVALYNLGLVEFDLRNFDSSYDHLDKFLRAHKDSGEMGQRAKMYLDEIRLKRKTQEGS